MRGERDPRRTPYKDRAEAMRATGIPANRRHPPPPPPLGQLRARPASQQHAHQLQSKAPIDEVQWKCVTDNGEVAYVAEMNTRLEKAFNDENPQIMSFTGGNGFQYLVNTKERTQVNRTTGTKRTIARYVNGHPSGWITKLDPQSKKYYFVDKYDSHSFTTWKRNTRCPSVPFGTTAAGFSNPLAV